MLVSMEVSILQKASSKLLNWSAHGAIMLIYIATVLLWKTGSILVDAQRSASVKVIGTQTVFSLI